MTFDNTAQCDLWIINPETNKPKTKRKKRPRKYLTYDEVQILRKGAKKSKRNARRNDFIILFMFTHGLRVEELIKTRWDQLDLDNALFHVERVKNGINSVHPLITEEIRYLTALKKKNLTNIYVFENERKVPFSNRAIYEIIEKAGKYTNLPFSINPHMLRHSCGFYLINKGMDIRMLQTFLGHVKVENTAHYSVVDYKRYGKYLEK